jgi:hypothetical protein
VPSQATIEAYSSGAIVRQCQHQIIFATDINSAGSIDVQEPDRKELKSNILSLMYDDPTSGQSVQIAQVQDSQGELIGTNEVLYTNAFQGIDADVMYNNRLDGMEQNVIIKEQLPSPSALGMTSQDVYLEVVTEFVTPPPATVTNLPLTSPDGDPDQAISWGQTSLGRGKAFMFGSQENSAVVTKQYVTAGGRYFLVERVRLQDIQPALSQLPLQASNTRRLPGMASRHFKFPKRPPIKSTARPMHLVHNPPPESGYVLDYTTLSSSYTNYVFQGDNTYYISSSFDLYGISNCVEGGSVIKYAAGAAITFTSGSEVNFTSAQYLPAVFTAKDDNTVGSPISGSTGNPSGYYANPALDILATDSLQLSNFRIAYSQVGIINVYSPIVINDAQFVNCQGGIASAAGFTVNNALFLNLATNLYLLSGSAVVNNATFANDGYMVLLNAGPTIYLTNCILANVTNVSGVAGSYNGFYNSPEFGSQCITNQFPPFQRVGDGNCYLTNSCAFLNAGTSNIDSTALGLIQSNTVYAPIVYSNTTISVATTFSPQAQRDNLGNPSLGFHYFPLDYIFGATIAQSNLTFSAGTAVGFFYNSSGGTYGLAMGDSATAFFNGTVTEPCRWARQWNVQEGGNGNWTATSYLGGITGQSYSHAPPALIAQFTDFYELAEEGNLFRDNDTLLVESAHDCEFYCGGFGGYAASINLTNCLLVNSGTGIYWNYGADNLSLQNCTYFRGEVQGINSTSDPWPVYIVNCAFGGTIFDLTASGNTNGYYTDYNSFQAYSNTTPYLGGHEVTVTGGYNWQQSYFGDYYLPSDSTLIQKGNTTSDRLGLYHFTTQTSQVPETNAVVDIGYHYVATDDGIPLDTNGDGIPDYLEDVNGNGLVDSGEIGWNIPGDLGLNVVISRPRANSVVP